MAMPEQTTGPSGAASGAATESVWKAGRGRLTLHMAVVPGVTTAPVLLEALIKAHPDLRDGRLCLLTEPAPDVEHHIHEALERLDFSGEVRITADLNEALRMAPHVILVEDLTEHNGQGRRHLGRLDDVEELLARGVDVHATVAVTQLAIARDLVRQLTGMVPRHPLPDRLIDEADEIAMADVAPAVLVERRQQGDRRLRALNDGLMTIDALQALRDAALSVARRKVAQSLESPGLMPPTAVSGLSGRVLVLLTRSGNPSRLVRAGRRLADSAGAGWTVAYAESGSDRAMRRAGARDTNEALQLAESLGAEIVSFSGSNVVERVMEYAHAHRVSDIVIGAPRAGGLWRLFSRPLSDRLIEVAGDIGVHMVADADLTLERLPVTWRIDDARPWFHEYLVSAVAAFVAAGLIRLAEPLIPPQNLSIVMLMAVIYAATAYGFAAGLFTAVLGIVLFNFFFLPPSFAFIANTPENILLLVVFILMAAITSNLAGRLHDQVQLARRRERHTAALFRLAREVATAPTPDDILKAVVRQLNEVLNVWSALFLPAERGDGGRLHVAYPGRVDMRALDWEAVTWVQQHGRPAGPGTGTYEEACCLFWPLRTPNGPVGVAGLWHGPSSDHTEHPQFRRRLDSLAGLAAVAIERMMLAREIEGARFTAQTESLRAALLSSISHDLRTPLASIIGSATSLLSFGSSYTQEVRDDLLGTILEEAERLNRFVGNLLQMTKLESGAVVPKCQWIDVDDLIGTTLDRLERRLGEHRVVTEVTPLLPPLYVDFVLMENVVTNLLDNAVKYAPAGSTITIRGTRDGDEICIAVADEGPGIAPEDHANVFDKFFRVYARDSVVAGTGLGLAICKGIVEAHNGRIDLDSAGEGKGAIFRVHLPVLAIPDDLEDPEGPTDA